MREPAEEEIRELFQELRREDARGVQSFADAWSVARSSKGKSGHRCIVWRLAAVSVVLAALGAGWWIDSRRSAREGMPIQLVRSDRTVATGATPTVMPVSQWRSPTESLLRVPGEHLFKRVPRLDESVVNIKAVVADQKENS